MRSRKHLSSHVIEYPPRRFNGFALQLGQAPLPCVSFAFEAVGKRRIAGLLLGSATVKVLTHSTLPVLVYRGT